jgi:uncharacterized membrane protein
MTTQTQDRIALERTTLINAPVAKVFAYYSDPSNLPEIWPSMLEVKDVERDEQGHAKRFSFVYKMAGMRFSGSSDILHFTPNERFVTETKGSVESTFDTRFKDLGDQTEVHETAHYRIPIPLIGKVAEPFLRRLNENELAVMHNNLKAKMETGV